jgi:hypothetical protein
MWEKILAALKQKSTWAGLTIIVNAPLLAFGVPPKIVAGIIIAVSGLAVIFLRQGIEKTKPKEDTYASVPR